MNEEQIYYIIVAEPYWKEGRGRLEEHAFLKWKKKLVSRHRNKHKNECPNLKK